VVKGLHWKPDGYDEMHDAHTFVGASFKEARKMAVLYACVIRAVEIDGKPVGYTDDVATKRINVGVRRGKIVEILGWG
jgi:hypothetical protein